MLYDYTSQTKSKHKGEVMPKALHTQICFVTGYSGAGRSSALNILEDFGYEVFDNAPILQIKEIIETSTKSGQKLAFGIDARTRGFSARALEALKSENENIRVIYLFCDEEVLMRRYSETRRRHPLAEGETYKEGIQKERALLADIPHFADISIDTSTTSVADLRDILKSELRDEGNADMSIQILSFGFKNGVPLNADMVMDVRFLKNPHYNPELKPMTGKDPKVAKFISTDKNAGLFCDKLVALLQFLIPAYQKEGKSHLTCAIGCTGGKHRSVYVAEKVANTLVKDFKPSVLHRDLGKE